MKDISARKTELRIISKQCKETKQECEACSFNHFSEISRLQMELGHQKDQVNPVLNTENLFLLQILDNRLQAFDAATASVKQIYSRLTPEQKEALVAWFNGGLCMIRELADNDAVIQLRRSLAYEATRPKRTMKQETLMDLLSVDLS